MNEIGDALIRQRTGYEAPKMLEEALSEQFRCLVDCQAGELVASDPKSDLFKLVESKLNS